MLREQAALLKAAASLESAAAALREAVALTARGQTLAAAEQGVDVVAVADDAATGEARVDAEGAQVVVGLFDFTCLGLEPWAKRGYECHAFDIRHPTGNTQTASGIHLHGVDLSPPGAIDGALSRFEGREVAFAMAFPPCTDLSRAGARYWATKLAENPNFQADAVAQVTNAVAALERLGCPFFVENPASSRLRSLYREPDLTFEPCWFGGYLEPDDAHPFYPSHIPNQDAYTKRTALWTGGRFGQLPPQKRVKPVWKEFTADAATGKRRRVSPLFYSGGAEGKASRHATPRGFAEAIACAYATRGRRASQ